MEKWLKTVTKQAEYCEESLKGTFLPSLSTSAYPLDGAMVEAILARKICQYDRRWEEAFNNGENPGLIPAPRITREDLVSIIRQCPVLQMRHAGCFDGEWLLRNLGRRFVWVDRRQDIRLGYKSGQGITQQDLLCADHVWKRFCPTERRSDFPEPTYFAPVPDLMWARRALNRSSPIVTSTDARIEAPSRRDDVWLALSSMPPRFLKSLQEPFQGGDDESSREFDQVIEMMSIRLQNTEKVAFIHDLRGALSHCEDDVLPVTVTSGVQLAQRRKIRKKMWSGVGGRYQQLYRKYIDRDGLLASTGPLDSLKPYPDLYHALAPAWSSSKPLMELTKVLIMELVQRGNRVELSENKDTLSIADVTSLLPGHRLTRTALYKITEAFSLQRASVSVISLNWMDDWAQRGETPDLLESLGAYFWLEAGASEKLVYIVPPTADSVQTLAICSVTSSDSGTDYSSTILIGKKSAFPAAEKFLTSLFKKVPQWSATGFLWKRIHSVDVQSISKTAGFPFLGEKVTKCLRDEDIGIALCAAVSISLSTGCSGLGELLGLGKISQEEVDLANVRLESLYVLQLLESAGSSLQADEVPDASESLSNHQDKVLDDDGTHDSDLDLGESDSDEAEMCGSYGFDNLVHPFKVEEIEAAMASIDMDDDEGIAVRIGQTLTAKEKHAFAFSAEDEAALCPAHGENDQQMGKSRILPTHLRCTWPVREADQVPSN